MSITKITIKARRIILKENEMSEVKEEEREYTRETYEADFDYLILENLPRYDVREYAEDELDMIDEDDCDCETRIEDLDTDSLIHELKDRGYEVIKCQTLSDSMRLEKVKELMEI